MKRLCLTLVGLVQVLTSAPCAEPKSAAPYTFNYERYAARGGSLFKSYGGNFDSNNSVNTIFVDSKGRVWVGTVTGLAVYDGNRWRSRTFKAKVEGVAARGVIALFRLSDSGPRIIVEGPPGTVWFGGGFGIWRYRDDRYEEITTKPFEYIHGMAVDRSGALWVVTKYDVQQYDGRNWTTVLRPYREGSIHPEMVGLRGIAIGTNGSVWVAATIYTEPKGPWSHEGPTWLVDAQTPRDLRPHAPLFEFDGKQWRAFGPQHGLRVKKYGAAMPEVDELGGIRVEYSDIYYTLEGDTWKPIKKPEERWVLREGKRGFLHRHIELLFRDGENLVEVRATDVKTGEVSDLTSDQRVFLSLVEDRARDCVWLGTRHGLYRIWREQQDR